MVETRAVTAKPKGGVKVRMMSAAATSTSFLPVATTSTAIASASATAGPSRFTSPSNLTFPADYPSSSSRPTAYPFLDGPASGHALSSTSRTQYRSRSSPRPGSNTSSPPQPLTTSSPPISAAAAKRSEPGPPLSPTSSSAHSTASSSSIRSASSRRSSMVASSSSATSSSSSTGAATTSTSASSIGSSRPGSVSSTKGGQSYKIGAMSALEPGRDSSSSSEAQASTEEESTRDPLHGGREAAKEEQQQEGDRDDSSAPMDISTLSVREDDDDDEEEENDGQLPQRQMRVPVGDGWDTPARTPSPEMQHGEAAESTTTSSGGGGSKTRRASVLSSSDSSAAATNVLTSAAARQDAGAAGTPSEDGTPGQSGTGRRKVARLGSFHGAAAAGTEDGERSARRGDDTPMSSTQADQAPSDSAASRTSPTAPPPPTLAPSAHHVDIVSYPSSDLLRLLAALLEQIAHANDERNARVAAAAAAAATAAVPPVAQSQGAATPGQDTEMRSRPEEGAASGVAMQQQDSQSGDAGQTDSDWRRGRFDAAPLNSPMTPRHRKRHPHPGGPGGPGILDNALDREGRGNDGDYHDDESAEEDNVGAEMPLTPGMDLLRETASGGGVAGFMPSLGGTHQPQPLSRRRGSSFLRNKRNDDGTVPLATRRTSNFTGGGGAPPASSAGSNLPLSAPSSRPGTASNISSGSSSPATAMRPTPSPGGATPTGSSNPVVQNETPLSSLLTASAVAFSSPNATLCFHARNVPSISIEAYLQRILKYCPTTNEVFLALLVYFDRMARIGLEAQRLGLPKDHPHQEPETSQDGPNLNKLFAIDSFNVHRLVIAGVTVASKFFSDVFYTNSRYAKVGPPFCGYRANQS